MKAVDLLKEISEKDQFAKELLGESAYEIGMEYQLKADTYNANRYFQISLECGEPKAAARLGFNYYDASKWTKSEHLIAKYLNMCPNQDKQTDIYKKARKLIGMILLTKNEYANAIKFLKSALALDDKDLEVKQKLAGAYFQMANKSYDKTSYDDALRYWKESEKLGYVPKNPATYFLRKASAYYKEKDFTNALKFFKKSADLGNIQSMSAVGNMYGTGHGCERDYDKAIEYFLKAAKKGDVHSYYLLGNCYYKMKKKWWKLYSSKTNALKYYKIAAEKGDKNAQRMLRRLLSKGGGD